MKAFYTLRINPYLLLPFTLLKPTLGGSNPPPNINPPLVWFLYKKSGSVVTSELPRSLDFHYIPTQLVSSDEGESSELAWLPPVAGLSRLSYRRELQQVISVLWSCSDDTLLSNSLFSAPKYIPGSQNYIFFCVSYEIFILTVDIFGLYYPL